MRRRSEDSLTLERWRAFDALWVLEKLGCYVKTDDTFEPRSLQGPSAITSMSQDRISNCYCTAPSSSISDSSAELRGLDLVMHEGHVTFKGAADLLRTLAI